MLKLLTLLVSSALAQPTPESEALGQKLMIEINAGIQCNANAIAGRREIERLNAKIKELEEKLNAK